MKPFFTYYGGKWRAAPLYPKPEHETIIEPFAGSAGYATRYASRRVVLVEISPAIASVWRYIISAKASEVRSLPLLGADQTIDDLHGVPQEARSLIGLWLNKGSAAPKRSPSAWMRAGIRPKSFWGPEVRERIASQAEQIRHWLIIEGSYEKVVNRPATWFVDPPYVGAGDRYPYGARGIDFARLGAWVRERQGLTIACEAEGAAWLPFERFGVFKANESKHGGGKTAEAIYVQRREAQAA